MIIKPRTNCSLLLNTIIPPRKYDVFHNKLSLLLFLTQLKSYHLSQNYESIFLQY